MAKYKVSYKVLSEQGKELKNVAKLVNTYGEKVTAIRGRLGDDQMLAEVRNNLTKFTQQMEESRAVLNLAGELLSKSVESYTQTESRGVKKVDNTKAHKRDFYKNPVVVASAGGAAAGVTNNTVNYTETTNVTYNAAPAATAATDAAPTYTETYTEPVAVSAAPAATVAAEQPAATGMGAGAAAAIGAGAGVVGGVIATGGAMGAAHLKKERDAEKRARTDNDDTYDPEEALEAAIKRVQSLEEQ